MLYINNYFSLIFKKNFKMGHAIKCLGTSAVEYFREIMLIEPELCIYLKI